MTWYLDWGNGGFTEITTDKKIYELWLRRDNLSWWQRFRLKWRRWNRGKAFGTAGSVGRPWG